MMLQKSLRQLRWKSWFSPWQETDWLLFMLPVSITIFGTIMIRSTELTHGLLHWIRHLSMGGVGVILALMIARSRYENLLRWHWIIYGLTNVSLLGVMVVGHSAKGAQRWIGVAGFNFQPSEFAKIALIITLAALLHEQTAATIPSIFRALAVTAVPWALIFLQPDLATSLVFGAIVLGMLYWGNAQPAWILLMISPIVAAIVFNLSFPGWIGWSIVMGLVGWWSLPFKRFALGGIAALSLNLVGGYLGAFVWNHILKPYQKDRLTVFTNPEHDPLGAGYHLIQSRIAIGAGELWGRGLNHGPMTQLNFVPEQHTDFIFSAVGEEFGFIGCLVLLFAFWLMCWRLLVIAQTSKDNFGSLLAIGVFSMVVFQVIINIGMTIGLAPVAGIPLPWMSYGSSAMLINFIALGIVESVANYRQKSRY